ncbi:superoxide dismutase, Ni [Candidatus Daviesbacteria bacterium RIFCSPHIGHO2_01_FULL_40_11]|uniref:Superoxide dismutase, Ni n=1 Tax=Candidatus Daviesbacteria bacterium RIFCSPHIGHO2_01_FULL_40_11 TaxID=1797762 RepID=A0A1F5JLU8_9BACT|nr:MAG: superoxide dismutase, Ni [Candidatus Daviesbacteria bacterium RIFCSPHIGHO2_01_FULL_40_11]
MMRRLANLLIQFLPTRSVLAHCDIPCGIYDPAAAQLAAKTVLTMVQKINQLPTENPTVNDRNSFVRMVSVKETHAEICKREVLILWTDYFKAEHLEKFPNLHDLVWKTTKLCSENKRAVDETKANELIESVDKIAEVFNQTKK